MKTTGGKVDDNIFYTHISWKKKKWIPYNNNKINCKTFLSLQWKEKKKIIWAKKREKIEDVSAFMMIKIEQFLPFVWFFFSFLVKIKDSDILSFFFFLFLAECFRNHFLFVIFSHFPSLYIFFGSFAVYYVIVFHFIHFFFSEGMFVLISSPREDSISFQLDNALVLIAAQIFAIFGWLWKWALLVQQIYCSA